MRHPVKLYISFAAFTLFVAMTMGMVFWFSTQTLETMAGAEELVARQDLSKNYVAEMKAFFIDYSKVGDKPTFLKEKKDFLFEIRVPKEFLDRHIKIVSAVEAALRGESTGLNVSEFAD